MAKNFVIAEKPPVILRPPVKHPFVYNASGLPAQTVFHPDQIDLNDYFQVPIGEYLKQNDLYFHKGRWVTTLAFDTINNEGSAYAYWRKKKETEQLDFEILKTPAPDIDKSRFIELGDDDILEKDDEWYSEGRWRKTDNIGKKPLAMFAYRRSREKLFSEAELDAARNYYGFQYGFEE